jgi:hypothetical protein
MNKQKQTRLRQRVGREQTKYTAGGREKRPMRQAPSLPKLKFWKKINQRPEAASLIRSTCQPCEGALRYAP